MVRYLKSVISLILFISIIVWFSKNISNKPEQLKSVNPSDGFSDSLLNNPQVSDSKPPLAEKVLSPKKLVIDRLIVNSDRDNDGIKDADDFIEGGRLQIELKPKYVVDYYKGGYPPDDIAVCTDIICRAFKSAGYDLKQMIDSDIKRNIKDYPRVAGKPDPNIDFRWVRNLVPFFKKCAQSLTIEVTPNDEKNLQQWQGGDLVVFYWTGNEHIAIVSDRRNEEGVPYLIHTYGSYPMEDDRLLDWADTITYHFRYPPQKP